MNYFLYYFVFIQLFFVSYLDIKTNRISNLWPILNLIIFISLVIFIPQSFKINIKTFEMSLVIIVVGFLLYVLKLMGGGDSKYLASIFLMVPIKFHELALESLLIVTITVGGSLFLINSYLSRKKLKIFFETKNIEYFKQIYGKKFPFAPIIFMSWVWFGLTYLRSI